MNRLPPPTIALLAVAVVSGTACGFGPFRTWTANHTRDVTVYTDAWIEHEYTQEWLQRSYNAYRAFFPDVDPGKVEAVWLKVEPGWYKRFYGPWDDPGAGWTLETMPGGGRIGREGLIVLERRDEVYRVGRTFRGDSIRDHRLAKRQMAHLFVRKAVPQAPLWLQIGLAKYMAKYTIRYSGDHYRACFGSAYFDEAFIPDASTRALVGAGSRVLIPLADLFAADWYFYDGRLREWYEYTSYALVHYLIHGERGFNVARFSGLLRALRDGTSTEEALALAYPHVLPDEWDDLLAVYTRPSRPRFTAALRVGPAFCLPIPPERDADFKPRRERADPREIAVLMNDLERVDPFRRHGFWLPADIVAAEAAKRGGRGRPDDQPGGGRSTPADDQSPVPTVRQPAPR